MKKGLGTMHILRSPLIAWSFVCLYAGTIFYLSSLSSPPTPEVNDKLSHMGEYALLTLLLLWAIHTSFAFRLSERTILGLAIFLSVSYGLLDEFHQAFVPGRDVSLGDVAADALGAIVVSLVWIIVRRGLSSA